MKNMTPNPSSLVRRLLNSGAVGKPAAKREIPKDVTYTLRVEDGVLHLNNLTCKPEGVLYTLMTEDQDGSTKLMNRFVSLAPFQSFDDAVEGTRVFAAWEMN